MSLLSCGPNCVCHPSPAVALRPRTKARRLPFAATLTTKNPTRDDIRPRYIQPETVKIESLSGGESSPQEIVKDNGGNCAACCSGVTFDLEAIVSMPAMSPVMTEQSLNRLKANQAFSVLDIDLAEFKPGTRLHSVPTLPAKIVSFEKQQAPISPPATPRTSSEGSPTRPDATEETKRAQNLTGDPSNHPPSFVQPHPPHNVFSAPVLHAEQMTKDGASKRVYHLSIDVSSYPLPAGETWLVGGSFGVCPANEHEIVEELLEATHESENCHDGILLKTEGGRWPTVWGDEQARTLPTSKYELLRWCSDVTSSPVKKNVLRVLAEYATDEYERQLLLFLVSKQGQAAFCKLRGGPPITLPHLLHAFPSSRPPLSHLLSILPQLMPRWYSLSSDPSSNHGTLDFAFTVAEVPHYKGHLRGGVGSGFLENLAKSVIAGQKDMRLPMFRGLHSNPFTKDFADSGPMILIGAGVGIAPFRGFVQRRVSSAKCAGKVYVIQGCRDSQFDGIYGNDLQSATHCIVESQAGRKEYVQDEVVRQGELVWRVMNDEGGRIYVCGAAKGFLQGIEKALKKVAREHGSLTEEAAKQLWDRWRDPLDLRVILEVSTRICLYGTKTNSNSAIANDSEDVDQAKAVLDTLQAEAIADGFEDGYTSPDPQFSDEEVDYNTTDPSSMSDSLDAEIGDDENLRFLKLSFPTQSLTTIRFVLNKCDQDVIKSTDELLNHELIDEERRLNAIVDGDIGTVDDFFAGDGQIRKRKRKQKQQRGALLRNELDPDVLGSKPVSSRWDQMGSEVDWMVRVLALSRATVQSAYHAHHSSLPAALNALIVDSRWEDTHTHPDHEDNYARLLRSYPSLGAGRVRNILSATGEELSTANEVANVLSTYRPSVGAVTSSLSRTKISSPPAPAHPSSAAQDPAVGVSAAGMTASQCREMAAECASRRDAAFRQAAAAHQKSKGDGLHGGTAMYYADVGRDHDARMRAWNMKAAQLSSVARSGHADDLDLHGLSVHEALVVVRDGLAQWYSRTRMLESGTLVSPLRVVTGKGLHSVHGEAKLLPAVKKYLDREGWRYAISGGCISVTALQKS
ncbi:FAD binding domain protein [Taphrina deformans PYCC 5710]|uniref:FAD binding domain protein n=1 Tax=Taphrina deformans (strain PYCC 5710 / ATCC 11124 / CBS 356.35 / IMI 108563 / JCM 9778 / NBRC 8474) TaxID=1097556 RepID=R4X789_TAPDE|nr:FAD binding domain protein [Taphrina deformans PYCC 5710]|eukprot:CCG81182.1 FAD binding domain protein [Taphrina deformans PYCC 5710]